ncbi:MAG: DUF4926 domain-containing protein [Gemmatimonadota bacterium]|nr:DUF4926 domain-containing protein [Gemmatimonadota bacterium]
MKLLDVVALVEDVPERHLLRGHMGTVVEVFEPGVFEVEFSDNEEQTYALATLRTTQLLLLRKEPVRAA